MHWVPEQVTAEVTLWRGYTTPELAESKGEFEGTFLSDTLCGMIRVRGMLVRSPGSLSIVSFLSLAKQLIQHTGLDVLYVQRHGKWKSIPLKRMLDHEEVIGDVVDFRRMFGMGQDM